MYASPKPGKGAQLMIWLAQAALPILLLVFVVPGTPQASGLGSNWWLPVAVSVASGVVGLYFWATRLGSEQTPTNFHTNMLIVLAFGNLIVLMGVFIGHPQGLPIVPFLAGAYVIMALVLVRVLNYWMTPRQD